VGDVYSALNAWVPFELAAQWDNVGLLAGRPEWPARRALLAIDLTDAVADEALARRVNLLVVYHPPIFKGIRAVTPQADCPTTRLPDLLAARISIIALHTALDAAVGGTNDVLLDPFDPVDRYPLEPLVHSDRHYKLVVFVPPREVDTLREALSAAGAGVIGHYSECSFELVGRGTFQGDETTHPTVGHRQVLEHAEETRLEMVVPRDRLGPVVQTLYARHSYEEPAFDLYPLHELAGRAVVGMGRVGLLRRPARGTGLLARLRGHVDLSDALVVGDLRRRFRSVTVAAGAAGVRSFCDAESLVLTGELKHHEALELQRRGITAVHLGHYASERPVLDILRARLHESVPGLRAELARSDRSPFARASAECRGDAARRHATSDGRTAYQRRLRPR
jgi:dinuclear metal center YbgI/SA1388 family protein